LTSNLLVAEARGGYDDWNKITAEDLGEKN